MQRVLLVEDDVRTSELVSTFLKQEGFEVHVETNGARAVGRILSDPPDAVILDWMLPDLEGIGVCARVRAASWTGPILMLTARTEDVDQIVGLETGADDYLAKPVRPRVLLARLRALLRRAVPQAEADASGDDVLLCGWVRVDRGRREVDVGGETVDLTTAEFDLLWLLASRAGTPVDRDALFEELRGIPYDGLDRSMDMRVSQLRKRLIDADPEGRDPIRTVRGVGYQLVRG